MLSFARALGMAVFPGPQDAATLRAAMDQCLGALIQNVHAVSFDQATTYALMQLLANNSSSTEQSGIGLTVPFNGVPVDATASQVTVQIHWIAPVHAPTSVTKWSVVATGGAPHGATDPWRQSDPWQTGETRSAIFDRTSGQELRITADIGGEPDWIVVPYIPRVEISQRTVPVSAGPYNLETDEAGHNEGPISKCEVAPDGGMIDTNTAAINVSARAGPLDNTTYARIVRKDTTQVCWEAFLRPLEASNGGVLAFTVSYVVVFTTFQIGK